MFSFGFYDSLNGDRKYNSVQMSEIFDGIIGDGVYNSIGELMSVRPAGGMRVSVGTGRAWFNHTWNKNDNSLLLDIPAADALLNRFDAIVLEVDRRNESRKNSIKVIRGTPSANPAKPALLNGSNNVWQHPLAFVKVAPNVTSIAASAIENAVGTSACPFVTGVVQTADIDVLFQQWEGEFTEWFENIKLQLTDNVVTNLQYQIDRCVKILNKATNEDVTNGTANKWVDAAQLKATNTTIASAQQSINALSSSTFRITPVTIPVIITDNAHIESAHGSVMFSPVGVPPLYATEIPIPDRAIALIPLPKQSPLAGDYYRSSCFHLLILNSSYEYVAFNDIFVPNAPGATLRLALGMNKDSISDGKLKLRIGTEGGHGQYGTVTTGTTVINIPSLWVSY